MQCQDSTNIYDYTQRESVCRKHCSLSIADIWTFVSAQPSCFGVVWLVSSILAIPLPKRQNFVSNKEPVHLLRSFIFSGSLTASFQGAVEQIRRATKVFDAETHLAHAAATNKFEQVLPHIDISLRAAQSVFSVSRAQNARFFGRKRELDELYHHLSPHDSEQKSCVLHGMAGVGKTQTALEFCYQKRGIFPYIFWIPAEDEAQLAQAYSKITHLAGTSSSTTSTDLSSDIDEAYQWLCRSKYTLFPQVHAN